VIRQFRLSRSVFAVARSGGPFASRLARGVGTTVTFRLSERARLEFTVFRRVVSSARARTAAVAAARRAKVRLVRVGRSFRASGRAGRNVFRFTGRVPRARGRGYAGLKPGSYVLVVRAVDRAGNRSRKVSVAFKVRARSR